VIYACLAETIVLALEGRFEVFTIGRDTEWEKVKEIYRLGLKHGMKLSAISGANGVYSDEDIARVVQAGQEGAADLEGRLGTASKAPAKRKPAAKKAAATTPAVKAAAKKAPAKKAAPARKAAKAAA
jgi:hypothetical protein